MRKIQFQFLPLDVWAFAQAVSILPSRAAYELGSVLGIGFSWLRRLNGRPGNVVIRARRGKPDAVRQWTHHLESGHRGGVAGLDGEGFSPDFGQLGRQLGNRGVVDYWQANCTQRLEVAALGGM